MAITTKEAIKKYLDNMTSIAYDDFFTDTISRAQSFLEYYCNRIFDQATITEKYNGGKSIINVARPPIDSVTAVQVWDDPDRDFADEDLVDTDDYAVDYTNGIIYFEYELGIGLQSVKVTYKGGFGTIPGIAVQACIELVAKKYKDGAKGELGIASRGTPSGDLVFAISELPLTTKLALDLLRI